MTQEETVSIDPTLAVALAKAAGLDPSPLEEQIRSQEDTSDDGQGADRAAHAPAHGDEAA